MPLKHLRQPTTTTSWNIRSGLVDGNNLKEWLLQTGNFATPVPPPSAGTLDGGFRVLFSPYTSFDRVSLEISRSDFEAVEETFRLHPATLPALEVNPGTFSRHFQCSSSTTASDNTDQICLLASFLIHITLLPYIRFYSLKLSLFIFKSRQRS